MRACFALLFLVFGTVVGCTISDGEGGADAGSQNANPNGSGSNNQNNGKDAGNNPSGSGDAAVDSGASSNTDGGTGGNSGGAGDAGGMSTLVDPAPTLNTPGEYGCEGCPDADISVFELDAGSATSQNLFGVVSGAVGNGQFYLVSEDGQSISSVIPTSETGNYNFTVPLFCGTQLLKCLWSNEAGTYVAVVEIVTSDCVQADIRLTLSWDNLGFDYELHLIKEGGQINDNATDCTWTSCIGAGPDWGEVGDTSDDPRKDVDNTGNFGPENIFYANPESGTYTVMVEHWGAGNAESDGQVTINLLGEAPVVIDITNLATQHVFTAATIEWPSKTVTVIGSDYDCTGNWSGGCRDAIP